jgi:hypothetical protein
LLSFHSAFLFGHIFSFLSLRFLVSTDRHNHTLTYIHTPTNIYNIQGRGGARRGGTHNTPTHAHAHNSHSHSTVNCLVWLLGSVTAHTCQSEELFLIPSPAAPFPTFLRSPHSHTRTSLPHSHPHTRSVVGGHGGVISAAGALR